MPRRSSPTTTMTPRPAPQFLTDATFVQERRTQFGRETWYTPTAIKTELASIIRRSGFYQRLSPLEVEYAERTLADWTAEDGSGSINIRCEPSWGVGADISFAFRHAGPSSTDEDGSGYSYTIMPVAFEAKVSWSSTGRSMATAQAAVNLYQEAINLGCLVSAKAEEYEGHVARIYRRIPNPAYVAEAAV